MPSDDFAGFSKPLGDLYDEWFAITPSDSADLPNWLPRAIFAGGAGTITARSKGGTDCSFTVTAGTTLKIRPKRILATGTSATLLIALR